MPSDPATPPAEPVSIYVAASTVVCVALAAFGIVVDPGTVATAALVVAGVVSQVIAAVKARSKVTPV
jgi:hypothetical protein